VLIFDDDGWKKSRRHQTRRPRACCAKAGSALGKAYRRDCFNNSDEVTDSSPRHQSPAYQRNCRTGERSPRGIPATRTSRALRFSSAAFVKWAEKRTFFGDDPALSLAFCVIHCLVRAPDQIFGAFSQSVLRYSAAQSGENGSGLTLGRSRGGGTRSSSNCLRNSRRRRRFRSQQQQSGRIAKLLQPHRTSVGSMPAARAASNPKSPSSKTWQNSGGTPNLLAASRNMSGAGFGLTSSSALKMTLKNSLS
jgi:hypothetical protein